MANFPTTPNPAPGTVPATPTAFKNAADAAWATLGPLLDNHDHGASGYGAPLSATYIPADGSETQLNPTTSLVGLGVDSDLAKIKGVIAALANDGDYTQPWTNAVSLGSLLKLSPGSPQSGSLKVNALVQGNQLVSTEVTDPPLVVASSALVAGFNTELHNGFRVDGAYGSVLAADIAALTKPAGNYVATLDSQYLVPLSSVQIDASESASNDPLLTDGSASLQATLNRNNYRWSQWGLAAGTDGDISQYPSHLVRNVGIGGVMLPGYDISMEAGIGVSLTPVGDDTVVIAATGVGPVAGDPFDGLVYSFVEYGGVCTTTGGIDVTVPSFRSYIPNSNPAFNSFIGPLTLTNTKLSDNKDNWVYWKGTGNTASDFTVLPVTNGAGAPVPPSETVLLCKAAITAGVCIVTDERNVNLDFGGRITGSSPIGAAGGDLGGSYPTPTVTSLTHAVASPYTWTKPQAFNPSTGIPVTATAPVGYAQLELTPGSTAGPPTAAVAHVIGEYYVDSSGHLWRCTTAGTGTAASWERVEVHDWYVDDYFWKYGGASDLATDTYNAWMGCLWDWHHSGSTGIIHGPSSEKGSRVSGQIYIPNDAMVRTSPNSLTDWTYTWVSSITLTTPFVSAHSGAAVTFVAVGHGLPVDGVTPGWRGQIQVSQTGGAPGYSGFADPTGMFTVIAVPDANHITVSVAVDPGTPLPTSGTLTPWAGHAPIIIDLGGAGTVGHRNPDLKSGAVIDGRFDGSTNLFGNDFACGGLSISGNHTTTISVVSPSSGQYAYFGSNASGGAATVIPAGTYTLSTASAPVSSGAGTWGLYISADGTLMTQANTAPNECLLGDMGTSLPVNGGHGQTVRIASFVTNSSGVITILRDDQPTLGIIEDRGRGRTIIRKGAVGNADTTKTSDGVDCFFFLQGNHYLEEITMFGSGTGPAGKYGDIKQGVRYGGSSNLGTYQAASNVAYGYAPIYRDCVTFQISRGWDLQAQANAAHIINPLMTVGGGGYWIDIAAGNGCSVLLGEAESFNYKSLIRIAANENVVDLFKSWDEDRWNTNVAITAGVTTSIPLLSSPNHSGDPSSFVGTIWTDIPIGGTPVQGLPARLGRGISTDPFEVVNIAGVAGTDVTTNSPTVLSNSTLPDGQHTIINLTSATADPAAGITVGKGVMIGATNATQEGGKVVSKGTATGVAPNVLNWICITGKLKNSHAGDTVSTEPFTATLNPAPVFSHPTLTVLTRSVAQVRIEPGAVLNTVHGLRNQNPFVWWDGVSQNDIDCSGLGKVLGDTLSVNATAPDTASSLLNGLITASGTLAGTTGSQHGMISDPTINPASTSTRNYTGFKGQPIVPSGTTHLTGAVIFGASFTPNVASAVSAVNGAYAAVNLTGASAASIPTFNTFEADVPTNPAAVVTGHGFVANNQGGGSGNSYAFRAKAQSGSSGTSYAFYADGSGPSFFGDYTRIGPATPGNPALNIRPATSGTGAPAGGAGGDTYVDSADSLYYRGASGWFKVVDGATGVAGAAPSGAAGGDLGGTYPNPTVSNLSNGTGLTAAQVPNLSGTKITSGTVAAARLPADVSYLDAAQSFTAKQTFGDGSTVAPFINHAPTASTGFGPPTAGTWAVGDVYPDQYGHDWVCMTAGDASIGTALFSRRGYPAERLQVATGQLTAAGNVDLTAPSTYKVNRIVAIQVAVAGTGTMPTTINPLVVSIVDDPSGANTTVFSQPITGAQASSATVSVPQFPNGHWAGTMGKLTRISVAPLGGGTWNANVTVTVNVYYEVGPPRSTDLKGVSQVSSANADNTFTIAAPGASKYNIIQQATVSISGDGTSDTVFSQTAPITATVKDGDSNTLLNFIFTSLTSGQGLVPGNTFGGGVQGSVNANKTTILDVPAAGTHNVSYINVFYRQA